MKTTVLQSGLKKISCNKKQLLKCYNIDAQNGEKKLKNFWKHLTLTFLIMGICWGLCLVLSFMLAVIRKLTGSVWLCVLCHAIVNSMSNFYHYDFYGSYLASSITAAVLIVISLLLIFIFKKKNSLKEEA